MFGPYGVWGLKDIKHRFIDGTTMVLGYADFVYPNIAEGAPSEFANFPISGSILYVSEKGKVDDDFAKKLETDMITKALSRLGFNADVFMGKFDDNKYVAAVKHEFEQVSNDPIRQKYVDRAVEVYRECVEADVEEIDTAKMQDVDALLTNDERIAVMNELKELGKMEGTQRAYTTIVNECLKAHPADNEKVEDK